MFICVELRNECKQGQIQSKLYFSTKLTFSVQAYVYIQKNNSKI